MKENIGIVLIHGAGLSNFIWSETMKHFKEPILPISFPNREVGDKANAKLLFVDYLNAAIEQIDNWAVDRFIIVAHSIGGCIGLKISDHYKERVLSFIAISAILPKNGKSFTSSFPMPQKFILPIILKLFGTKPPQKVIKEELCNGLEISQSKEVIERFSPESIKLYTTKIHYDSLPKNTLFIKLSNDKSVSQNMQNKMIENLNCKEVVELNSGHLLMLSKPKQLAEIINNYLNKTKIHL
ncbi:alpha/beta fold hydrolase [Croceitalea marina]|uniref:Alpha/beta fold hydrolase n=1 Tax=Croceitalea marina TaxID=1775166 RepID=A0ABW5MV59_9FLAO